MMRELSLEAECVCASEGHMCLISHSPDLSTSHLSPPPCFPLPARALLLNLESLFLPKTDALVDPELTRQPRLSLNTLPSAKNFPIMVN